MKTENTVEHFNFMVDGLLLDHLSKLYQHSDLCDCQFLSHIVNFYHWWGSIRPGKCDVCEHSFLSPRCHPLCEHVVKLDAAAHLQLVSLRLLHA